MKSIVFGLGAGVIAASSLAAPRQARACGGCFARPTENTIVTDHRMAFSVSPVQTVLWDQIKYTGSPSAFSWVLPVRRGAVVQLSHDEWFAALDATTSPIIYGPTPNCGGGGVGCGFASKSDSASADFGGSVQVINQSVVGPYDTVTLRSTDPHALETWLVANDFTIPDSIRPTIAAYVTGGFDFIALRLQPGQGVQSMQPVRIVTPGADVTLPLRMVAAGVGAQVGITLFVISEGRYEARPPFANAVVDDSKLVWLHAQGRSNYQETSQALMQGSRGRTWLTESAGPVSLVLSSFGVSCVSGGFNGSAFPGQSLADVYSGQCACNPVSACGFGAGGGVTDAVVDGTDAVADANGDASYLPSADATDAMGEGPEAAAEAAAADATGAAIDGASSADANASAGDAPAGETGEGPESGACTADPCAGFDDLDVASVGMHEGAVWITRLRAVLPSDALGEGDLQIQASASQMAIPRQHNVNRYDDAAYSPCPASGGCSASAARPGLVERGLVAGAFGIVGIALLGRRARRRRP